MTESGAKSGCAECRQESHNFVVSPFLCSKTWEHLNSSWTFMFQRTCLWYVWCSILWCKLYIFPFCCDFMISSHWAPVWVFVASLGLSATVSRVGRVASQAFCDKDTLRYISWHYNQKHDQCHTLHDQPGYTLSFWENCKKKLRTKTN